MLVVDTNILAYLLIPGQRTALVKQLLNKDSHWIAPVLWKSELRNVFALYLRKNLLDLASAVQLMKMAETIMGEQEYTVPSQAVLKLSLESGCSAYDCEYIVLAMVRAVPLVTCDRKMIGQFPENVNSIEKYLGA